MWSIGGADGEHFAPSKATFMVNQPACAIPTSDSPSPKMCCIAAVCHPATYWMTGNTIRVDGGENIVG